MKHESSLAHPAAGDSLSAQARPLGKEQGESNRSELPARLLHTFGKWHANGPTGPVMQGYSQPWCVAVEDQPILIAGCFGDIPGGIEAAEANARLIVRCVNSQASLIGALTMLAHYAECQVQAFASGRPYLDMTAFPALCRDARAAIERATS